MQNPLIPMILGHASDNRPIVGLAPMAGVTDLPFRTLCEKLGADYSVTEMAASAPQLLASQKNQTRLHFTPRSRCKILQIIGNDAKQMANAAQHYAQLGAEIIDINLGCPAKKISSKGAGSALLSDLSAVKSILTSVTKASPVPVTVKTRLGPDHDNYTLFEVADMAQAMGISLITVHGRTRADKFNGSAQFDEIARVKQAFPLLTLIANGDINNVGQALHVLDYTQCDGILIGRGAVGNPWLFQEIKQSLNPTLARIKLTNNQINNTIMQHIRQTHDFYGDEKGVRFARKHIQKYLQHLGIGTQFSLLAKQNNPKNQLKTLQQLLDNTLTKSVITHDYA